jgi:PhoH-like ATPase
MSKIFIIDTNVLLHDPRSLFAFEDNEVVIPLVVLDELDKKKTGTDEVARHAREVIRSLDKMRDQGNISEGVATLSGGLVRVELGHSGQRHQDLDPSRPDNKIISVAMGMKEKFGDTRKVCLVSKDINLRVKCDALGVLSEDYNADSVVENPSAIYTGTRDLDVDDEVIDNLRKDGFVDAARLGMFYPNEYACLRSFATPKKSSLVRYDKGRFVPIQLFPDIWGISSRNKEQAFALDALFNPDIKLVTMIGRAGSGKTLLAAASGISQLLDSHKYKKMIMTRPIVAMGGKDIGYLPGTMEEKMAPWMAPLQDNLELLFSDKGAAKYLEMQKEAGLIEVEALTYIRGRSIPKSYIIVDEVQNLTSHEVKTIITRAGDNSKIVMTGDVMQIDNFFLDAMDNGLSYTIEKFKDQAIAAHVTLQRGERSELASIASEIM